MTLKGKRVLVCGAGGFIGGHMVRNLLSSDAASVRAVDCKPQSNELITINQLVMLIEEFAGVHLKRRYNLLAPRGVSGRNSGSARIQQHLGWSPSIALYDGVARTYHWIEREMTQSSRMLHHAGVLERYATA